MSDDDVGGLVARGIIFARAVERITLTNDLLRLAITSIAELGEITPTATPELVAAAKLILEAGDALVRAGTFMRAELEVFVDQHQPEGQA